MTGQPLTLTRDADGYRLSGDVGALTIGSPEPLSAAAAERYVVMFGRGAVVVDLPADDPLSDLGRGVR